MNTSNVHTSSTPATASSSLRPRTRRLISGLSDADDTYLTPSARQPSPLPSSYDSRPVSPIPAGHLSRPHSRHVRPPAHTRGSIGRVAGDRLKTGSSQSSSTSLADLWGNSWTAIQGIASDLLGNDVAASNTKDSRQPRTRKPPRSIQEPGVSSSAQPSQWGPAVPTSHITTQDIGAGTRDEQVAAFRAQKRQDMLTRQESSYADTLGRFKRRLSDDRTSASAPPGEDEERDALVYVHHVGKDDTVAGITIKYNCSANTLRKANRMWPNDTVQSKKIVVLPVDGCSVKGKPVSGPEHVDWLGSEIEALSAGQAEEVPSLNSCPPTSLDGQNRNRANSVSTTTSNKVSSVGTPNHDHEPPWRHDSWVLFPGSTKPIEIARLSRRALGYFPPARRKSNGHSDFDSTSSSLDLARPAVNDPASLLAQSPRRLTHSKSSSHGRRLSNADNGYFPSYLAGPGGVGTMNRNVRVPGPAQDGLNKMFAKHLPDVAPPRHQQLLMAPEMPLFTTDPTPSSSAFGSGATTPNFGKPLNLENVGGQIESWMRRMATKATQSTDRQHAARASVGAPGRGAGGIGDLIEMTDEFEIGDDEQDEGDDGPRGRQASVVYAGPGAGPASLSRSYGDQTARERAAGKRGKGD